MFQRERMFNHEKIIKNIYLLDRFMSTNGFPNTMQMGDGMSEC